MENLLYALKDNKLVSIDEVERGLVCGCVCPACKKDLIAKKGNIKIHHFAHVSSCVCEHAYETSLHLLAKKIFEDVKTFLLPDVFWGRKKRFVFEKQRNIQIKSVQLEYYLSDVRPDIFIEDVNGEKYCIEIFVTHSVDKNKCKKFKEKGLNAIEIDLSNIKRLLNENELKEIIVNNVDLKNWLYNKNLEEGKDQYAIPIEKLKNCVFQESNQNFIWCMKHCRYGIDISKGASKIYCERAKEVLAKSGSLTNLKFCTNPECGCLMKIVQEKDGDYYRCTGYPFCNHSEKIHSYKYRN